MKRFLSLLLFVLLLASLTACSQPAGSAQTPAPTPTEAQSTPAPTEAPTPSPSPTPEPEAFVPEDLFGSAFNPYAETAFPDNFTMYGASFNIGVEKLGGKPHYTLYMTAEGDTDESIAFLEKLAGIEDAQTTARAADFKNGGFYEFQSADGTTFTIRKTDPNDDRYAYVDGCRLEMVFNVDAAEAEKYIGLIRDNYNLNALASIAEYLDTETDFSECDFSVNLYKKEAAAAVVYYVSDAGAVQQGMAENMQGDWWEWNGLPATNVSYGIIGSTLIFDKNDGAVMIEQKSKELNIPLGEYIEPEFSLTKLGFGFDPEGICGVYEQHEPHYMNVAIHRPEWGEFNEDWNLEYLDAAVNGYGLRITYHAAEGKYHITADKDNSRSAFDYYPATKKYTGEHPDMDTVKRMFNDAFGTQGEDFYDKPLVYFEQLVQERFGMSVDELYALPIR